MNKPLVAAGGGCEEVSALARRGGSPVSEDDARVVCARHACARGIESLCAKD